MVQGQDGQTLFESEGMEDDASQHESSVGWLNKPQGRIRSSDSDCSREYLVMVIRSKKDAELKVARAKLPIEINGRETNVWIDSGPPISILTIRENRKHLAPQALSYQK